MALIFSARKNYGNVVCHCVCVCVCLVCVVVCAVGVMRVCVQGNRVLVQGCGAGVCWVWGSLCVCMYLLSVIANLKWPTVEKACTILILSTKHQESRVDKKRRICKILIFSEQIPTLFIRIFITVVMNCLFLSFSPPKPQQSVKVHSSCWPRCWPTLAVEVWRNRLGRADRPLAPDCWSRRRK